MIGRIVTILVGHHIWKPPSNKRDMLHLRQLTFSATLMITPTSGIRFSLSLETDPSTRYFHFRNDPNESIAECVRGTLSPISSAGEIPCSYGSNSLYAYQCKRILPFRFLVHYSTISLLVAAPVHSSRLPALRKVS
jgi:hypothetical protein